MHLSSLQPTSHNTNTSWVSTALLSSTVLLLVLFLFYVGVEVGVRHTILSLIGVGMGVALYATSFGFTGSWRCFIRDRDSRGIRVQMMMFSLAVFLFFPTLSLGSPFGGGMVYGFVFPVNLAVVVGSLLFGVGMQLGGGCGSGTLYTVAGGSLRMVVTLIFFVVGSFLGSLHLPWWHSLPGLAPYSFVSHFGWVNALVLHLLLFAGIGFYVGRRDKVYNRAYNVSKEERSIPMILILGGLSLALFNYATLLVAGRPWGITSAFALWGAKVVDTVGVDVAAFSMWSRTVLDAPVVQDINTVMNIGILFGAFLTAFWYRRFIFEYSYPLRAFYAAILGGLLLGYGARLAFGCNIGALFSGLASGSLHAWLWGIFAFLGNIIGVRLRPFFQLS